MKNMDNLKQISFYRCPKCSWISPENIPDGVSTVPYYSCPNCYKKIKNKQIVVICDKITMLRKIGG